MHVSSRCSKSTATTIYNVGFTSAVTLEAYEVITWEKRCPFGA